VECGPGCGCPYIAGLFLPGPRVTPLCPARNSGETVRLQQPGLLSSPEMSCSCRPARPRGDGDTVTRGRRGRGPPSPSLQVHMASPQGDGDTGLQGWGHSEPGGGGASAARGAGGHLHGGAGGGSPQQETRSPELLPLPPLAPGALTLSPWRASGVPQLCPQRQVAPPLPFLCFVFCGAGV
jgi:hypothetical protein